MKDGSIAHKISFVVPRGEDGFREKYQRNNKTGNNNSETDLHFFKP